MSRFIQTPSHATYATPAADIEATWICVNEIVKKLAALFDVGTSFYLPANAFLGKCKYKCYGEIVMRFV